MSLTIIFVRHGESTANVDRIFANRPGIPGDLTPAGIAQAEALARSLADAGLTHISTSPLPRAVQTAEIISRRLGVPVDVAGGLREYDVGEDEGLSYTGDGAWRWKRYEAVQRAWRDGDRTACHPGGECLDDMERRFLTFMGTLPARHGTSGTVLAVGHGGLFHMVLPAFFALPGSIALRAPLAHTDRVIGVFTGDVWLCTRWAETEPSSRFP